MGQRISFVLGYFKFYSKANKPYAHTHIGNYYISFLLTLKNCLKGNLGETKDK